MKKQLFLISILLVSVFAYAQKNPIKVACVGNSITYGYGIDNREQNSYPSVLQQLLGKGYEVGNFGHSGATLLSKGHKPYIKQDEYKKALAFAGDIVVIHLGINDTDPRNWPNYRDEFVKDYLALIKSFREANPKARIIIARMTPLAHRHKRFESGTRDWHAEIQHSIELVAQEAEVQLINFHEPLYHYPQMLPDAVHPNAQGAAILAQIVYGSITGNYGGLQLPQVYSSNMVLQHGIPLTLHGIANTGTKVEVKIGNQKQTAIADTNGKWAVTLDPLRAKEVYTLAITAGKEKRTFTNVAAGEVWLCSGQSNMEFYMNQTSTGSKDIPQANNPNIRLYDMKALWRTDPVEWKASVLDSLNMLQYYAPAKWEVCTPETISDFSAIAYYFGKTLQKDLDMPIGLICNAIGGSPTEAWIDRRTLEYDFPAILYHWRDNDFIMDWVRSRASQNIKKSDDKLQRHPYEPAYLFEAGIIPLQQFPIQGVIWYQGESNAHNKDAHSKLFPLLVKSWRNYFGNMQMPFYYVQLSSINRPSWGWFRDSQRRMLSQVPYSGMAVAYDYGNPTDVHPKNKQPIGERLAYWALNKTYGKTEVTPSGPLFKSVRYAEGAAFITFDYAQGLHSSDGKPLRTFELSGSNGIFYPATAEVVGNQVKVTSPQVPIPTQVRFGWQPVTDANLLNEANLPASTFTTEK